MITKVGYELNRNKNTYRTNQSTRAQFASSLNQISYDSFVSFTGESNQSQKAKLLEIMHMARPETKEMLYKISESIKDKPNPVITPMHIINAGLQEIYDYMIDLDEGKVVYTQEKVPPIAGKFFANTFSYKIYSDDELRSKVEPIIKKYLDESNKIVEESENKNVNKNKKRKFLNFSDKKSTTTTTYDGMTFSDDFIDFLYSHINESSNNVEYVNVSTLYSAFANSGDNAELDEFNIGLLDDVTRKIALVDDDTRRPFTGYQNKAEDVVNRLLLGSNTFLTYDDNAIKPYTFLDTVHQAIKDKNNNSIKLIELDSELQSEYMPVYSLNKVLNDIRENKDDVYILALNPIVYTEFSDYKTSKSLPKIFHSLLHNPPENVRLLFFAPRDEYYSFSSNDIFNGFNEVSIPNLDADQIVKYFGENRDLLDDFSSRFSDEALNKAIRASYNISGAFPDKTIGLINNIDNYYSGNVDSIDEKLVENYLSEAKKNGVLQQVDDKTSVKVVNDTGIHLSDMVGKDSTRKDAQLYVNQILNGDLGTKGVLIYSQDGSPGAGRHFTAKAIAGEAQIPYIETNAYYFGIKDVGIFGEQMSPDASMKKLFSLVKSKAEVNPNRSAVLFIDNFEYFSVSEYVSDYHRIAMAQLLVEMDKAQDAGLNILVVGSVPNPEFVGEAAAKSLKFVDTIAVESPMNNADARRIIIKKALEDNNIEFANDDAGKIMKYAVDLTQYNSYLDIKSLIQKAESVANERGHQEITKADLTEAFLRIVAGRTNNNHPSEHSKMMTTSHECGHATNLEVMNNVTKTLGKPWHVPNKVNFVTLDPRGMFLGAVFNGHDINEEVSFENVFSSLVCSYGGYSAEKHFYNQCGSGGITQDMKMVKKTASAMVRRMGMGPTVGTGNVQDYDNVSDKMKEMIEHDERLIINNARATSDMITNVYAGFNEWFTEKYSPLVGTGECMIDGDEFREALKKWRSEQSPEKQKELDKCDQAIIKIMEATKKGIMVKRAE